MVSGDTLKYEKPHPAPLQYACTKLNTHPSQTLYVGDAARDMEAALAAGMPCMVAKYGYIGEHEQPHTWGAHYHIENAGQLLELIKSP